MVVSIDPEINKLIGKAKADHLKQNIPDLFEYLIFNSARSLKEAILVDD